jgi:predicted PurR-regulated permease PerM
MEPAPHSESASESAPPTAPRPETIFEFALRENWPWLAGLATGLLLMYFLAPIMAPFVIGSALAYLGDPLVDRLQRLGLSRSAGVAIVFVVLTGLTVLALALLVPMLYDQVLTFLGKIPDWLLWMQNRGLPRLGIRLPPGVHLDVDGLRKALMEHWSQASDIAAVILGSVGHSTPTIIAAIVDLAMIPLVAFYLLRDWGRLVVWVTELVPRPLLPAVTGFARETDQVLSGLIRGQLSVMAVLAIVYGGGLTLIGLDIGLLLGIAAGLLSFIPYVGFLSGLIVASIAMLVQEHTLAAVLWVFLVFGIGQILEGGVLTPMLVGDRIGLHPVAVIFAIMAGGQLFGFVGVLVALPTSAVLAVLLRHTKQRWLRSPLYRGRPLAVTKPDDISDDPETSS